jgi:hypothetical protein
MLSVSQSLHELNRIWWLSKAPHIGDNDSRR